MNSSSLRAFQVLLILMLAVLAGCQTQSSSDALAINSKEEPRAVIVSLAKTAQNCWFKSGDKNFTKFRLAAEVNSHAGRPRFLLVPKNNPGGLPSLVIQAEQRGDASSGTFTRVQTFGPLLETGNGQRITSDVQRWISGNTNCGAA